MSERVTLNSLHRVTQFFNMVQDRFFGGLSDRAVSDLQLYKKKDRVDVPTELTYIVMNCAEDG